MTTGDFLLGDYVMD